MTAAAEEGRRPNVVIILFDDLGFSDFGCFGSEIETPNIDRLAAEGLRYTGFSVTPLCSPTRASLLTGRNHHTAQVAFLAGWGRTAAHTQERISPACGTVAEILRTAGYETSAFGKWHLVPEEEMRPEGPFDNWPTGRGFNRFYGFLGGHADHYHPALVQDRAFIEPPDEPDYHLSSDLVDRAIADIDALVAQDPDQPFLLYVAFGAVHSPYHVPAGLIDTYVERFSQGWDNVRQERLARQIALGIVPPGTQLTERLPSVPAWDELSSEEQALAVRVQAAYAAFLEHTDAQIGRLMDRLATAGLAQDTLVVLLSDNGAATGGRTGTAHLAEAWEGTPRTIDEELADLDEVGGPATYPHYADGWGMAGNTPFRRHKTWVDGGGVRVPLIVRWPAQIPDPGGIRPQFCHVVDIVPTILDAAGATEPETLGGIAQVPMAGASLMRTLVDAAAPAARDVQYFEISGQRAIWQDGWRAVATHEEGTPLDSDTWALYDTRSDFSESTDLAHEHPERVRALQERWWTEAERHGVLPLDDRRAGSRHPEPSEERDCWVLPPSPTRYFLSDLFRTLEGRSFRLEAQIGAGLPAGGAVVAAGGVQAWWWALVLNGQRLALLTCAGGRTAEVECRLPHGHSPNRVGFDFHRGESDTVRLWADDHSVSATVTNLARFLIGTLYIGWCPYPGLRTHAVEPSRAPARGIGNVTILRT